MSLGEKHRSRQKSENSVITVNVEGGGKGKGADLTGGAVGEAGFIVSSQIKICGAGTFLFPTGGQKTQVAASSVCNLTLVLGY